MTPEPLTYERLLERQAYRVSTGELHQQTAANRATALRKFLKANRVAVTDVVGDEMRVGFPDALEAFLKGLVDTGHASRTISNTRSLLTPWRTMVVEDDTIRAQDAGTATPFQVRLKEIVGEFHIKRVARQAEVPYDMLLGWFHGKVPRAQSVRYLVRLEAFFGMKAGELTSISGLSHQPHVHPEVGVAKEIEYRKHLPSLTSDPFWLHPPSDSPLRKQWLEFVEYKTSGNPVLERSRKGVWRFSPLPMKPSTDTYWYCFLHGEEVASAHAGWSKVAGYLGWLGLAVEKGGMGIAEGQLQTLAWIALPNFVEKYIAWRRRRSNGKTSSHVPEMLGWFQHLVRADVGYFPQCEWLSETLPAEYRPADWTKLCQQAFKSYGRMAHALRTQVEIVRDPFEPIEHIVDMPEPMEAVVDMVRRMKENRPIGNSVKEAVWARDLLLIKLLASNPLRVRHFAHLTWNPDNSGSLYQKADGSWWITYRKRTFKNALGAAGDIDYDSEVQPNAWVDIERYLFKHRPNLMRHSTNLVFLTSKTSQKTNALAHVPWEGLSGHVGTLTKRYLWRCDGVRAHGFRQLTGTSIVKAAPGEMMTVARVLNDRVETVEKHYARFRSNDGSKRMGELLSGSFRKM